MTSAIEAVRSELREMSARGLADAFSRAVRAGTIAPGQRIPSIRATARELELSPTTVSAAWRLLAQANLIFADGARGTVVADSVGHGPDRLRRALAYEARFDVDLSTGLPDPALLPDLAPALHRLTQGAVETFLPEPIIPELREHLVGDWPTDFEDITIVNGGTDALDLLATTLLQYGDLVGVENPSYPPLLDILEAVGARIVPFDVDAEGPIPSSLQSVLAGGVRAIFLQPRAQIPTGASLTATRAQEIAKLLAAHDAMVIESDLSYGVASSPLSCIAEVAPSRTVHIRSYSLSHGPDLRLAAVAGPSSLVSPIIRRRHLGQGWTSRLLQRLLLDLLSDRDSSAQIEEARQEYARRRQALVGELADAGVDVFGGDGTVIWVPVENEAAALMVLSSRGVGVAPGSPYLVRANDAPHLAVTCGLLPISQAKDAAAVLAMAAGPSRPGSIH